MVFKYNVLEKINEPLTDNEIQDEMKKILSEKGVDVFSKMSFLDNESLFDKIIQYNTDCAKLGKFNPMKSVIEHTVDKRIHYLADNPQFTFQLGKILQEVFEERGLPVSEQPIRVINNAEIKSVRDKCPSKVSEADPSKVSEADPSKVLKAEYEYCGHEKEAQNERKRDQALCALQRGIFNKPEQQFVTCESSDVCSKTEGGKKKTKGKKGKKGKKTNKATKSTNTRKKLTRKRKA